MSPIGPLAWAFAICFQLFNALSIGGWLAGYGPVTAHDWAGGLYRMEIGLVIWGWFFLLTVFHDDDLREIRRAAMRRAQREADRSGKKPESIQKVYMLPKNGLFHYILYPHYFCEWIEWCGFWMVGGLNCGPARTFVVNEVSTMLPRALQGWDWYVERFGREKVGKRKAIIPGLL
jgi:3-oxo-5-alpha-steroid 4-dehydrogenase 1